MQTNFDIRKATAEDVPALWALVRELAIYERAEEEHLATPEEMLRDGFGSQPLYGAWVATVAGEVVGMALYYYRYSTWKGKCFYLEDFYVQPIHRSKKIGAALFKAIICQAAEEQCRRISWQVLDWNTPAIEFYQRFGASIDGGWLNGGLDEAQIQSFAQQFDKPL
ncbi:GNAT family N-acetyltransferase [Eisenibacter elegans]|jgi:GNAT superfamily N-acetyltransferase|uniref:GNAT family N-acetyltransferase n=1 Tax=Eisenibacter elegans TaxID=997 RepID=UPI0004144A94|nr:GNAT family N-acetyltransferase [Eisenibacter elegans]